MPIAQALHGYRGGHRLLAQSVGLSAEELDLLSRLSDLSGPLPHGLAFEHYLTGYPCGRYYALAATWSDREAPRGGAVVTHTLLVPLVEAAACEDLRTLCTLHRRPAAGRADGYDQLLEPPADVEPAEVQSLPPPVAGLLYGSAPRPLHVVTVRDAEAVARAVWASLWPEARRKFAFCTLALQARALPDRPFDLLLVPPEARGAFHRERGTPSWLDFTELGPTPAWAAGLAPLGAAHRLVDQARAEGLPLPDPPQLHLVYRLDELTEAATERLTAARTRADLLARLWPEPTAAPRRWDEAIGALLRLQHTAPLSPRPYWDLVDLLGRPQCPRTGDALFPILSEVVRAEVARRLLADPALDLSVLASALTRPVGLAALAGVTDAVARAPDARWIAAIVDGVFELEDPALAEAVVAALPTTERPRLLRSRIADPRVASIALRLRDAELLLSCRDAQGAVDVQEVLALVNPGSERTILARVPPQGGIAWALVHLEPERLASVARGLWEPASALPTCLTAERGVALFAVLAEDASDAALRELLAPHTMFRMRLAVDATPGRARRVARDTLDPAEILTAGVVPDPDDLALVQRATPELIRRLLRGPPSPVLREWLSHPRVGSELSALRGWQITNILGSAHLPTDMLTRLLAQLPDGVVAESLLVYALEHCSREDFDQAAPALTALSPSSLRIDAEILGAVRRLCPSSGPALVERTFVRIHTMAQASDPGVLREASWWSDLWWNRARAWRHWLADNWIALGWPADALTRILAADPDLRRRVRHRLSDTGAGRRLLDAMGES